MRRFLRARPGRVVARHHQSAVRSLGLASVAAVAVTCLVLAPGASASRQKGPGSRPGGNSSHSHYTRPPCDIYAANRTPCAAAYSSTRALVDDYRGPLYQVKRASDKATLNIGVLKPGGYANAAAQDAFCANTTCVVRKIYDQTTNHNDLHPEGPSPAYAPGYGYYSNRVPHDPVPAAALPVVAGGHHVYGLKFDDLSDPTGYAYNDLYTDGVPMGSEPESTYGVFSGTFSGNGCCFDFGNSEDTATDNGAGHMDALNFGSFCWDQCPSGSGPWVQADLENGVYLSNKPATGPGLYGQYGPAFQAGLGYCCSATASNLAMPYPFVTAMLNNDGKTTWSLRGANAQRAGLTTFFSGALPPIGYAPMSKEGAIILGSGGDQGTSSGEFFEGVVTTGVPSRQAEDAVQANIVAVGYHA